MSTSSINSLASSLTYLVQNQAQTDNQSSNLLAELESSSDNQQSDSSQLSPFGQVLNTLQQLQQSNPTEYAQLTLQISTNLQNAARTATSNGHTAAAAGLTQLSDDFETASTTGQLPSIQGLAEAIGGGRNQHYHPGSTSSGSGNTSGSGTNNTAITGNTSTSQTLSQLRSDASSQSSSPNPLDIILNTLSNAGVSNSNS